MPLVKHRLCGTETYKAWHSMIHRCHWKSNKNDFYKDAGIVVCEEWRHSAAAFREHMGDRPPGMTLDRIDNSKGYEPGNCRWATPQQQAANRSTTKITPDSALLIFGLKGVRRAAELAEEHSVSLGTVHAIWAGRRWSEVTGASNTDRSEES